MQAQFGCRILKNNDRFGVRRNVSRNFAYEGPYPETAQAQRACRTPHIGLLPAIAVFLHGDSNQLLLAFVPPRSSIHFQSLSRARRVGLNCVFGGNQSKAPCRIFS